MKIVYLISTFPQLTFIYRMIAMVAQRRDDVVVAASRKGNWQNFAKDVPLPDHVQVRYMVPPSGFKSVGGLLHLVRSLLREISANPGGSYKLWRLCQTHEKTRGTPFRSFIRHLSLINLPTGIYQLEFYLHLPQYPLLRLIHPDAKIVVSCRGADIHFFGIKKEKSQRERLETLRTADAVHCVSAEIAAEVTRLTGRTHNIWVNRPAIDATIIQPKEAYNTNAVPVIINVGRLNWKKGHDYLLQALRLLKQAGVPFKMYIVGSGELYAQMRFSIGDLDLAPEVELLGRMRPDEVFEQLRKADIYVLSSYEEGISNAVLEGMAAGLPVVTTTAGGMEEAVRDGLDGFVVPIRDSQALADKLKILLQDPALREKMGRSARQQVEMDFTLERQARVFMEIYQALEQQAQEHAKT